MGFFSSIGKAIKSVTKPISSFVSDSGVSDILGFGNDLLGTYNNISGNSAKQQKEMMEYQSQLQYQNWEKQMKNRHQLEVGDLRSAGLNPILSAHSAGQISASIPNGSLADSDSARYGASSSASLARQNAIQTKINQDLAISTQQTNASTQEKNRAEAEAALKNAESNRINALAGARRQASEAHYADVRASNELAYPNNQPSLFKYINSGKQLVEDLFDRNYGLPSNASPARRQRYEVFINGVGRRK